MSGTTSLGSINQLPSALTTRLVRNHDTVHSRACRVVARIKVTPWQWAEGKPDSEIAEASANGLGFCKICDPLSASSKGLGSTEQ